MDQIIDMLCGIYAKILFNLIFLSTHIQMNGFIKSIQKKREMHDLLTAVSKLDNLHTICSNNDYYNKI